MKLVPRKKRSQYQVPALNISSKNINIAPMKHGLHHNFKDKNQYVKRHVAVELELLATTLENQVHHT